MKKQIVSIAFFLVGITYAANNNGGSTGQNGPQVQTPMPNQKVKVANLMPVVNHFQGGSNHYALSADSVAATYPELIIQNAGGSIINYNAFIPILIQQIQQLQLQVARQDSLLEAQARKIEELSAEQEKE